MQDARAKAQAERPGKTITKIELESEEGVIVYSVRFSDGGRVDVSAVDGTIKRVKDASTSNSGSSNNGDNKPSDDNKSNDDGANHDANDDKSGSTSGGTSGSSGSGGSGSGGHGSDD